MREVLAAALMLMLIAGVPMRARADIAVYQEVPLELSQTPLSQPLSLTPLPDGNLLAEYSAPPCSGERGMADTHIACFSPDGKRLWTYCLYSCAEDDLYFVIVRLLEAEEIVYEVYPDTEMTTYRVHRLGYDGRAHDVSPWLERDIPQRRYVRLDDELFRVNTTVYPEDSLFAIGVENKQTGARRRYEMEGYVVADFYRCGGELLMLITDTENDALYGCVLDAGCQMAAGVRVPFGDTVACAAQGDDALYVFAQEPGARDGMRRYAVYPFDGARRAFDGPCASFEVDESRWCRDAVACEGGFAVLLCDVLAYDRRGDQLCHLSPDGTLTPVETFAAPANARILPQSENGRFTLLLEEDGACRLRTYMIK